MKFTKRLLTCFMTLMCLLAACDGGPAPGNLTPTPLINTTPDATAATQVATVTNVPPTATSVPTPFTSRYTTGIAPTPDAPKPIRERGIFTSTYAIQKGDTLGAIALNFNVSEDDLRSVNNLTVRQANRSYR